MTPAESRDQRAVYEAALQAFYGIVDATIDGPAGAPQIGRTGRSETGGHRESGNDREVDARDGGRRDQ